MKKIFSIVGARPQFIKHAPMQLQLQKHFDAQTIHTGQHYDENMSEVFFTDLMIPPPEFKLNLSAKTHGHQTAQMMVEIEKILVNERPHIVLVYGDTNSTLAGALVASKLLIPVVHIEAGLRSFNKAMPEEVNRVLTDHISDMLFCPSIIAVENLNKEGIINNVYQCGDVMKDILYLSLPFLRANSAESSYYFATIHRPYNTDVKDRMLNILESLQQLDQKVIFPIHPRTSSLLESFGININLYSNVHLIKPVGYFESLAYQKYATAVITDSGGMQKEAYWLNKKCVTIRKETEWIETLNDGHNTLLFDNLNDLATAVSGNNLTEFDKSLYGDANAAQAITKMICKHYY